VKQEAGKTQFCMQLCFQVQLPERLGGLNGAAVYITSEDVPIKRLKQMSSAYQQRFPSVWETSTQSMDKIYIETAATLSEQRFCFNKRLPTLLQKSASADAPGRLPVKLVIVDSITALFRVEFENHEYIARSQAIAEQARMLNQIATRFGVVVLVTNQVTDVFDTHTSTYGGLGGLVSSGRLVRPALGLVWSQSIFQRLCLSRRAQNSKIVNDGIPSQADLGDHAATGARDFVVDFAPHLPRSTCAVSIDDGGVKAAQNASALAPSSMSNQLSGY